MDPAGTTFNEIWIEIETVHAVHEIAFENVLCEKRTISFDHNVFWCESSHSENK